MKVAILTSLNQWFVPYAQELSNLVPADLYFNHTNIDNSYDIVFMLSYHRIVPKSFLLLHKHNIVIHASQLPK